MLVGLTNSFPLLGLTLLGGVVVSLEVDEKPTGLGYDNDVTLAFGVTTGQDDLDDVSWKLGDDRSTLLTDLLHSFAVVLDFFQNFVFQYPFFTGTFDVVCQRISKDELSKVSGTDGSCFLILVGHFVFR